MNLLKRWSRFHYIFAVILKIYVQSPDDDFEHQQLSFSQFSLRTQVIFRLYRLSFTLTDAQLDLYCQKRV